MPTNIQTPPATVSPKTGDSDAQASKMYDDGSSTRGVFDPKGGSSPPDTPPSIDGKGAPPPVPDANKGTEGSARVVPDKYDLKLPDGSLLNAKATEEIASFAKEKKLTQEEAQAILERESALLASYVDSQKQQLAQQQKEWVESIKTDKELGGDGFNKNIEMAKRVVDRYGTDSFKKALNDSGLGNHPELVRFVSRIGKIMSEDQLVIPGTQSTGKRSLEEIFYPSKP